MNEDIDNNKDYQIMELKQRISYYGPYKQKYEDLKEDWKYIKSLLDKEFNERTRLKKENEQLKCINDQLEERLEKENRELNSIKKFAEKNGINIFLIDEAFRKCWKDNGKLFEENEQLEQKIKDKNTYQRVLEAKIRRLKDRIKVLEKNE